MGGEWFVRRAGLVTSLDTLIYVRVTDLVDSLSDAS